VRPRTVKIRPWIKPCPGDKRGRGRSRGRPDDVRTVVFIVGRPL
jgi:hypothetical protein